MKGGQFAAPSKRSICALVHSDDLEVVVRKGIAEDDTADTTCAMACLGFNDQTDASRRTHRNCRKHRCAINDQRLPLPVTSQSTHPLMPTLT